ncbi:DNA internalization-related competence protein ComEC/Rec2 [Apilactobacillus ozensis]|nr:DNA internalization-related competence protein ComEC/Rec2 [Apilactobacillus ozensis]
MILKVYPDELNFSDTYFYGTCHYNKNKYIISGNVKFKLYETSLINVDAKMSSIDAPTNFNQFNSKKYNETNDIYNRIKVTKINEVNKINNFSLFNLLHDLRYKLLNIADNMPKPLNIYTKGLLFGKIDNDFSDELNGVKTLGLIHLFSISGLHVYLLVSFIRKLFYVLGFHRQLVDKVIIILLPMFFVISGSSVGLMRSILLVELAMVLKFLNLKFDALNLFSLVLIIHLFLHPQMIFQFGCQLSYLLSLGLIFLKNFSNWKLTLHMNLISLPLILYNTYEWHILTILANIIIIPVFSLIIIPVVIIGDVAFLCFMPLCSFLNSFLKLFDLFVNFISSMPGVIHFGKPEFLVVLLAIYLTFKIMSSFKIKLISLVASIYLFNYLYIHFPITGEVSFFDVGQGDSFLIRTPFNKNITVIDTGGKANFMDKSNNLKPNYASLKTSINYLKSIGINRIDNLCISHQDDDHCGDLPAFLTNMTVDRLVLPLGINQNKKFMNKILPNINKTKLVFVKNDYQLINFPFTIYHPFNYGIGNNDDSMVLAGTFNNKKFLFMGDLSSNGEDKLINVYPNLNADVLKLGHHGSKTSSSENFLEKINPKLAIISAGKNNLYHHPNVETIYRLNKRSISYLSTQNYGMISYCYSIFGNDKWVSGNKGGGHD